MGVSGAGGMFSGRNPARKPDESESGYIRDERGMLVKNPNYKPAAPVTRPQWTDTVPDGYQSPFLPKPGEVISGTAGASAMMSGNRPDVPVVSSYVPPKSRPTESTDVVSPTNQEQDPLVTQTTAVTAEETRTNSNGMVQTGRNMSTLTRGDDNLPYIQGEGGLLDRVGLGPNATLNSGWASNQLPGTASSPYGGQPVSRPLGEGPENVKLTDNLSESGGATQNLEGMPEEAFVDSQKGGGQRNWMEKGPEDAAMARRRAFLDAPNSMAGMRAVDAQLGRVRAGGDYHYINPNKGQEGEPEFIKVSTETGRAHQNGQLSGQQLLAKHMDRVIQDTPGVADSPSPDEFSPDMTEEQFSAYQATGGSQKGFTPDMEEDDFIAMQNM